MKRGAGLQRKTPLKASKILPRSTQPMHHLPIKKRRARVKDTIVGDLRALANGRKCKIRLQFDDAGKKVCLGPSAPAALCHFRMGTGVGQKPADILGAHGCDACHAEVDGRTRRISNRVRVRQEFLEGMHRTIATYASEGYELRKLPDSGA